MHVSQSGLIFNIEFGTASLIKVDCKLGEELIIPPIIKGFPLERIEASVFAKHPLLKNVGIPASVKSIGENAFAECKNLQNVKFYKTPRISSTCTLQKKAFYACPNLQSIHFPDKNLINGDSVFQDCVMLSDIKGKFKSLLSNTYRGCYSLTSLLFYGKTFVSASALMNCPKLAKLTFTGDLSEKTPPKAIEEMQKSKILCYANTEFVNWAYEGVAVEIMEICDFFDF